MSYTFSPYSIKGHVFKNRIIMPPMCMYSAGEDGLATSFHATHYISRAVGGAGAIIMEATGVLPEGRLSEKDLGLWDDRQIQPLADIVHEVKKQGTLIGIQLGHGGRKANVKANIYAPSALQFSSDYKVPIEMTKQDIHRVIKAFGQAAKRADQAGFDLIELHGAHGYLINQFLSPLTNHRTDEYGGELLNRVRILGEILGEIQTYWPKEKLISVRVSALDYNGGNSAEDVAEMINLVKGKGIDIIHVSTGGVVPATIDVFPGYQTKPAEIVKNLTGLPTITGGLLLNLEMLEDILGNNRSDFVFLGRLLLRDPYFPLRAAAACGADIPWPQQYVRAK